VKEDRTSCWPLSCASGRKHSYKRKTIPSAALYSYKNNMSWLNQIILFFEGKKTIANFNVKTNSDNQKKKFFTKKDLVEKNDSKVNCFSYQWLGFFCEEKPWYSVNF